MQKLYELVVLIHPQLSKDEQSAILSKIDGLLGSGKKETDDMGLVELAHPITKNRLSQVNIMSYYCSLDSQSLTAIKKELSITKGVVRHTFFSMDAKEPFHTHKAVNKKFADYEAEIKRIKDEANKPVAVEGADGAPAEQTPAVKTVKKKAEMLVKKGYFNKDEHLQEISWKAGKLLTIYITRFGEIKPRRYMGNSVRQQKKVRQAILRARELGLIAYTN